MSIRRLIFGGGAADAQRSAPSQSGARGTRLLWVAEPVLLLVTRLRATTSVPDLGRLRERLADVLRDFQASARAQGVEAARIAQATEVLAALIDHTITSMPWGADAGWQPVATVPGGRRPAQRLLDIARAASADAGAGELISVAVSLGFERSSRGAADPYVDQLLALLAAPGRKHGVHADQGLAPEGRSPVQPAGLTSWLALWASSLVVAASLAALYFALQVSLGIQSDRVFARMAAMSVRQATAPRQPAPDPRLAGALAEQIAARTLIAHDEIDRSVVVIAGSSLFEPGTTALKPGGAEVLRPVASVLQRTPGRIRIIGHTDGAVARSARFPSDWEFSVERARVVEEALGRSGVESARLGYDGRANIEPLAAAERSALAGGDGRIEIVLLAGRR